MLVSCVEYTVIDEDIVFYISHSPRERVDSSVLNYLAGRDRGYMYYETNTLNDEQAKQIVIQKLIDVKFANVENAQLELNKALKLKDKIKTSLNV